MWKVCYKSVLSGFWCDSYLGVFGTESAAKRAGKREFDGRYEWRVEMTR